MDLNHLLTGLLVAIGVATLGASVGVGIVVVNALLNPKHRSIIRSRSLGANIRRMLH